MALHMRLHEFGKDAVTQLGDGPVTLAAWGQMLDGLLNQMMAQRKIFLMHERNQAALERLHRLDHEADHEDLQIVFRRILSDPRVALADRVRMAASFGVIFSGLFLSGDAFSSTSESELRDLLHHVLTDVLGR
jgi:hypothetical protein